MSFSFEDECRKYQVDESFTRRIDKKLFPLLEKAVKTNPAFNMFLSKKQSDAQKTILHNFVVFENLLGKIKNKLSLTRQEIATLFLLDYMVIVESLFTYMVDIISYALVSTEKVLKDPRTDKEAVIFEEIRLVPLGTKLDFIRSNNFSLIANRCCIRIRNSAAHLSYTLDKDGNISLPQGDFIKIFDDMNVLHDKLRDAAIASHIALRHFYYEKYGKKPKNYLKKTK